MAVNAIQSNTVQALNMYQSKPMEQAGATERVQNREALQARQQPMIQNRDYDTDDMKTAYRVQISQQARLQQSASETQPPPEPPPEPENTTYTAAGEFAG